MRGTHPSGAETTRRSRRLKNQTPQYPFKPTCAFTETPGTPQSDGFTPRYSAQNRSYDSVTVSPGRQLGSDVSQCVVRG